MLTATVDTLLQVTAGTLLAGDVDVPVSGIVIDSRSVTPGCAFIAVVGERVDGNDFAADALLGGARVAFVTRESEELLRAAENVDGAVILVEDGTEALRALASWHRSRLSCVVVGVSGSTGKTTTKDLLTRTLSMSFRVTSTEGNRNNELGLPLTVLSADPDCEILIVEMGMRGLGQIAELARIARPTIGLLTNVGTSHIELLGSQDRIASAKAELVRAIPEDGAVFLNGDDAYTDSVALDSAAPVTRYGLGHGNDVRAENIVLDEDGVATFDVMAPQGEARVTLPVPGRHNVYNALAAAAVSLHLGVSAELIAQGLSSAPLSAMRMEIVDSARGVTIINDAYNANPSSMRAATETLASMRTGGRKIAVLGDMGELGSLSELAHFHLGEEVARLGIDTLVTIGQRAKRIADGALAEGMDREHVRPCLGIDEGLEVLDDLVEAGDVVLVKASRMMGLEAVVDGIVNPRV